MISGSWYSCPRCQASASCGYRGTSTSRSFRLITWGAWFTSRAIVAGLVFIFITWWSSSFLLRAGRVAIGLSSWRMRCCCEGLGVRLIRLGRSCAIVWRTWWLIIFVMPCSLVSSIRSSFASLFSVWFISLCCIIWLLTRFGRWTSLSRWCLKGIIRSLACPCHQISASFAISVRLSPVKSETCCLSSLFLMTWVWSWPLPGLSRYRWCNILRCLKCWPYGGCKTSSLGFRLCCHLGCPKSSWSEPTQPRFRHYPLPRSYGSVGATYWVSSNSHWTQKWKACSQSDSTSQSHWVPR